LSLVLSNWIENVAKAMEGNKMIAVMMDNFFMSGFPETVLGHRQARPQ
jgi:hypothetical protein